MKARSLALLAAVLACASLARVAHPAQAVALPEQKEVEDALPEGGSLTGRQIFDRFLDNRLHSAVQYQTVISRDPGGKEQRSRFWVRWKDYRAKDQKAVGGVLATTVGKFEEPQGMRQK